MPSNRVKNGKQKPALKRDKKRASPLNLYIVDFGESFLARKKFV